MLVSPRNPQLASLYGHVRPAECASAQQHVPDKGLYGRLSHESDEEQLLDDVGRHRP